MSANWNSDSLLHGLQQNVTGDETISQLDSMRWFFHRRSPSPPGGTQWYRLAVAACCTRPSYGARPTRLLCIVNWDESAVFRFIVPDDLEPWPLTLTFELGWDFCTVYLIAKFDRPKFSRSEVIERTNKQTNTQTN